MLGPLLATLVNFNFCLRFFEFAICSVPVLEFAFCSVPVLTHRLFNTGTTSESPIIQVTMPQVEIPT